MHLIYSMLIAMTLLVGLSLQASEPPTDLNNENPSEETSLSSTDKESEEQDLQEESSSSGSSDNEAQTRAENSAQNQSVTSEDLDQDKKSSVEPQPESSKAESSEAKSPAQHSRPVMFREKTVFKLHANSEENKKKIITRAQKASRAIEKAMTAAEPLNSNAKLVETEINKNGELSIRIRGYKILKLTEQDQKAANFNSMKEYQEQVSMDFNAFVSKEYDRVKLQKIALQFFLSVFFALMGFVVFRKVRSAFNQADLIIEQKRESFKPFVFLSESLISGQTLGGLLTLFLVLGRALAYFVVVLTTIAAISGQFRLTRNIMSDFFSQVVAQTFKSFQSLLEAIPGLFLAATLLFFLYLSLKILNLFLKGVRSGRISWSPLMGDRIPVVHFWGTILLCTLFAPLVIASLFGGFHTPLEIVGLIVAAVIGLSTLPTMISIATGSYVLWQGNLRPGQWIRIGNHSGEITDIALHKMVIVPEAGGRVHIPMIQLLYKTCVESKDTPHREYRFAVKRETDLDSCMQQVQKLFKDDNEKVYISCRSISSKEYLLSLRIDALKHETQIRVYKTLSDGQDKGLIKLGEQPIEELYF